MKTGQIIKVIKTVRKGVWYDTWGEFFRGLVTGVRKDCLVPGKYKIIVMEAPAPFGDCVYIAEAVTIKGKTYVSKQNQWVVKKSVLDTILSR